MVEFILEIESLIKHHIALFVIQSSKNRCLYVLNEASIRTTFDLNLKKIVMEIKCSFGSFKIVQTMKNKDELLILSNWKSLCSIFGSNRIFLINKNEEVFGIYICKQECAEKLINLIKTIEYSDWDQIKITNEMYPTRVLA